MTDRSTTTEFVQELFAAAAELSGPARTRVLDGISDAGVRGEVERLLELHDEADGYLDDLALEVLGTTAWSSLEPAPASAPSMTHEYEVLELLGEGGMGRVYKARDQTLARMVALKFLPAGWHDVERLLAEARAASALDHPNIAAVYQVGRMREHPGQAARPFIAMPLYKGATLREKLSRGPLPATRAMDWLGQAAQGLAAAHAAQIVHRDVKPENLFVASGNLVKVLDFGVATLAGAGPRLPVGTPAYMSPEQLRGEAVTPACDVWALGVVLYECLVGARPYPGSSREEVLAAIDSTSFPAPFQARPEVPERLVRVIEAALVTDAAARLRDAAEFLDELRLVASFPSRPSTERPTVLVLPFTNISADPANEYLGNGVTEEVITGLSAIRSIRVIARGSSMRLKGPGADPALTEALSDVDFFVEGGVRRSGDRVRVTVRVVAAESREGVWSGQFDGSHRKVLEIQERVARGVAEGLSITLSPSESDTLARRPIDDLRAYDAFLRARHEAWRFSPESLKRAERQIQNAIRIVGDNELLYSTLGHVLAMAIESGMAPGPDALVRADRIASRIFALNGDSPRAHWLKAFCAMQRGDLPAAIRAGRRALQLASEDPDTLLLLGYVYAHAGFMGEAEALLDQAAALDPLTPVSQCMPGLVAFMEGRYDEAVAPYARMYELDADSPFSVVTYGWVLAYAGRTDEAVAKFRSARESFPDTAFASWAEAFMHGLSDRAEDARNAITPAFVEAARSSEMFARALTHAYCLAGNHSRALDALERTVELGMWNLAFLERHDRFLEPIRAEARFGQVMARVRDMRRALSGPL